MSVGGMKGKSVTHSSGMMHAVFSVFYSFLCAVYMNVALHFSLSLGTFAACVIIGGLLYLDRL
jgi:hypothetical protein